MILLVSMLFLYISLLSNALGPTDTWLFVTPSLAFVFGVVLLLLSMRLTHFRRSWVIMILVLVIILPSIIAAGAFGFNSLLLVSPDFLENKNVVSREFELKIKALEKIASTHYPDIYWTFKGSNNVQYFTDNEVVNCLQGYKPDQAIVALEVTSIFGVVAEWKAIRFNACEVTNPTTGNYDIVPPYQSGEEHNNSAQSDPLTRAAGFKRYAQK